MTETLQVMGYAHDSARDPVASGTHSFRAGVTSVMPPRASTYLESIPIARRRLAGQVYTPQHLAEFILDQAGYVSSEAIETRTVLDPSCGCGVFLVGAVRRLVGRLERCGLDPSSTSGRALVLRVVARNLYGIDVDARACDLARTEVRTEIERLLGVRVSVKFFLRNVIRADYLLGFRPVRLAGSLRSGVDFIVGNPPYVTTTRIDGAYKERLRRRFETASGRLDLYTLFIERSLALLSERGRIAFITPNKFLVSVTSRPLRSLLLARGAVRTIVNFRSHRVFQDAATVPCITVFEHGKHPGPVTVLECDDRPAHDGKLPVVSHAEIDPTHLGGGPWHLPTGDLGDLAEAIHARHPALAAFTSRVSAGIATGCDGIYVLPAMLARDIEPELRRPAVRGRDLAAHRITESGLEIVLPYVYGPAGEPQLADLGAYPRTHAYLQRHRALLEKRHCCRVWKKAWYGVHDPVPFDLAVQPKILVPDIARSNRFAFDPGRFCPLHSAYYLIPKGINPLYLTAVLNSKPVEFLIRLRAPVVKDGFSRYRRQFLLELPVPNAANAQVLRIVEAVTAGDYAAANAVIDALFALSSSQQRAVDRFLAALISQQRKPGTSGVHSRDIETRSDCSVDS